MHPDNYYSNLDYREAVVVDYWGDIKMNSIVKEVLHNCLDDEGKIKIPEKLDRVLLDIGTSYNAPHCQDMD